MKKKNVYLGVLAFLVICVISTLVYVSSVRPVIAPDFLVASPMSENSVTTTKEDTIPVQVKTEVVKLGFVGDIMLDRSVEKSVLKNGLGDYYYIFKNISSSTLKHFDWLFGNLEGPVSNKGKKICGSIYSFQMDPQVTKVLTDNGFKMVSLANNHMFDYCNVSFVDTLVNLTKGGLDFVGGGNTESEAYSAKYVQVGSTSLGVLAYTEFGEKYLKAVGNNPGLAVYNKNIMCQKLKEIKDTSDLAIVSFHFGTEYDKEPNVYQKTLTHQAVDCGADIVVGHHPHVTQPLEYYLGKPIVYSLGNFVFDQSFSSETMTGNILSVTLENKNIKEVELLPFKMNQFFQPISE